MKFELVDFYPIKNNKNKKILGTVHIYAIDCELDIRGILVFLHCKKIFFKFPYFKAYDQETNEEIKYPHIIWTNNSTQKEMMDFLKNEVSPKIFQIIKDQK